MDLRWRLIKDRVWRWRLKDRVWRVKSEGDDEEEED